MLTKSSDRASDRETVGIAEIDTMLAEDCQLANEVLCRAILDTSDELCADTRLASRNNTSFTGRLITSLLVRVKLALRMLMW
jgi:hypothetical protein